MKLEDEIRQTKFINNSHKAIVNIIYTNNWLVNSQTCLLKKHNLTMQQYNILRILRGQYPNPSTIKLIKERMLDKMSDASRIVEKLRMKGLIDRTICDNDRRNVDVFINKKGLNLLASLDKMNDENDKLMSNLSNDELLTLNDLLDKLRG